VVACVEHLRTRLVVPDESMSTTSQLDRVEESVPHLILEPTRSWVALNLRDLWAYRELLYFLTWRDVRVRYKQTVLGAGWAVLQPLFTMIVFTIIFGRFAKLPSDGIPYPLFAYSVLMPWTFFANALTTSSNSLVVSSGLITKVYFPRLIMPAASIFAGLVDFACSFVLLIVLMAWYRVPVTSNVIILPMLVVMLIALAIAVGTWLAALHVRFRDVRYIVPFLVQFWMYATPIIYPASIVPERFRVAYELNPLVGIVEGFRVALLSGINGASIPWRAIGIGAAVIGAFLVFALYDFRRMERSFADVV
jgi:lipopolysaccharide transport system permease protein